MTPREEAWYRAYNMALKLYNAIRWGETLSHDEFHKILKTAVDEENDYQDTDEE